MKYWVLYFLAILTAVTTLPMLAQNSVVGEMTPTLTVCKDGETIEMTVDEYTLCVLIAHSGAVKSEQTQKALAVAARSCAMYFSVYGCKHSDYNVCSDGSCCIALGDPDSVDGETLDRLSSACDETRGQVLTLDSMPAIALFTRCASKGTRECEEFPYLTPVAEAERCEIHKTELEHELTDELAEIFESDDESNPYLVYDENEKCRLAIIGGKVIDSQALADTLSLGTLEYTLSFEENKLKSVCYGIGHGYGLNLCGAERLAENGFDYEKILEIYFPKLEMNKIYQR